MKECLGCRYIGEVFGEYACDFYGIRLKHLDGCKEYKPKTTNYETNTSEGGPSR